MITKVSYSMVEGAPINVHDYGAVGDGIADDTAALVAASADLQNGKTLYFPKGTYLISADNAITSIGGSQFAKAVLVLDGLDNITLEGNNATIKISNHDCSTGGLIFANFKGCQNIKILNFNFDMTFTGVNTSASLYPQSGAIVATDDSSDGQSQSDLNSNFYIFNCTFKLFHPFGQYAQSGAPYNNDPNNGFKIFSVFVSGPYQAVNYENQSRNVNIENCVIKDGHNAYGFWTWAWNNVTIKNCIAENWVAKYSNNTGNVLGGGTPFIRYSQFYCSGLIIDGCNFKAKPCSERTIAGYEGGATFASLGNNLRDDYDFGSSIVTNNIITLGNGDQANGIPDYGVSIFQYGKIVIQNNLFDSVNDTTNAITGVHIFYNATPNGNDGKGSLVIDGNIFGPNSTRFDNIRIQNASDVSEYDRRLKYCVVTNNISQSQSQYFFDLDGVAAQYYTYVGCRYVIVQNNIIDGTYNTTDKNNPNSRAINYESKVSTDKAIISLNQITNKYSGVVSSSIGPSQPTTPYILFNQFIDVTVPTNLQAHQWNIISGSPEGVLAGKVGSLVTRSDGGSNTTLYIKETGSGNTGWVAK